MHKPKVWLTGSDTIGWALDDDMRQIERALTGIIEPATLSACEVIHSVWFMGLEGVPPAELAGKHIVCHASGEPFRYLTLPEFRRSRALVGHWIAQSRQAQREFAALDLPCTFIPYTIDAARFHPVPRNTDALDALRARWNIPTDRYLIGNFHRDTEGSDRRSPKLVKGPDIFLEVVRALHAGELPIHVVLAGPRRQWLRAQLRELGIPFSYAGEAVDDGSDDYTRNLLPQDTLNLLYNLLDLYVISSRSEGGPRTLLEAAAARCKLLSTPVGLAPDVLEPGCLYHTPTQAAKIIARDLHDDHLAATRDPQAARVYAHHRPAATAPLWNAFYARIAEVAICRPLARPASARPHRLFHWFRRRVRSALTVGVWQEFMKPPYGGGNQFMLALCKALRRHGIVIRENVLADDIDVYLLNSIHFDVERFQACQRRGQLRVVHRIDGPIHLIRGFDREKDERCFQLNAAFANATVIQSAYTYQRIVEMGYQPVNAIIAHNAVDADIFHQRERVAFDPGRKIRLISSSWSDNPRKGGPVYKWIEEHLDWTRFEYTFVGNASERFERIRQIAPVPSAPLADLLRQHDIYITASRNDPCSNAVIEALACGLPVLYLNDGGHPELVGAGGLPFDTEDEILPQLEELVAHYAMFQRLITINRLEDVANIYLTLLREAAQ